MDHREVPIAEAALALKRGYQQTRDLVLRGVLAGRQDARGRWLVSWAAVTRLQREDRERQPAALVPVNAVN